MSIWKKPLPLEMNPRFDNDVVDAAKGVLILLVIFGHASNFWTPEPFATFSIKFFHVACFLLFPFIYDVRPLTKQFALDRFARYFIPFAFFVIGYGILNLIIIRGIDEIGAWLIDIPEALFFGTAPFLDEASALRSLWFMPVLISLVFLNAFFIGTLKKPFWLLMLSGLAIHGAAGFIGSPLKYHLPFGLVDALYLLWLGFIVRFLCAAIPQKYLQKLSVSFLLLALIGICSAYMAETLIKFPVIALPSAGQPVALLIHDVIIISMFMFLVTTRIFKNLGVIKWCGQNSLTLYFTHLIFLAAMMQVTTKLFETGEVAWAGVVIVFWIFTIALSGGVICAILLNKFARLKAFIMPRSYHEWPPSKMFSKGSI